MSLLAYSDGTRLEGEFRDGKPNGHGVETYSDGTRLEGEFRDGKPNGHGVMMSADGSRYEGEWRDGKWNVEQQRGRTAADRFLGSTWRDRNILPAIR